MARFQGSAVVDYRLGWTTKKDAPEQYPNYRATYVCMHIHTYVYTSKLKTYILAAD